jgi:hypothetical protein
MEHCIGKVLDLDTAVVQMEGAIKANYSRPTETNNTTLWTTLDLRLREGESKISELFFQAIKNFTTTSIFEIKENLKAWFNKSWPKKLGTFGPENNSLRKLTRTIRTRD